MNHIWTCTCRTETPCTAEEQRAGAVFRCPGCKQLWGGLRSRGRGGVCWIKVQDSDEQFYDFTGRQADECRAAEEAQDVVLSDEESAIK